MTDLFRVVDLGGSRPPDSCLAPHTNQSRAARFRNQARWDAPPRLPTVVEAQQEGMQPGCG